MKNKNALRKPVLGIEIIMLMRQGEVAIIAQNMVRMTNAFRLS